MSYGPLACKVKRLKVDAVYGVAVTRAGASLSKAKWVGTSSKIKLVATRSSGIKKTTPADLVAWRQNLTERWGDLDAAARTAQRTVLNSSFWAEQIHSIA